MKSCEKYLNMKRDNDYEKFFNMKRDNDHEQI